MEVISEVDSLAYIYDSHIHTLVDSYDIYYSYRLTVS